MFIKFWVAKNECIYGYCEIFMSSYLSEMAFVVGHYIHSDKLENNLRNCIFLLYVFFCFDEK